MKRTLLMVTAVMAATASLRAADIISQWTFEGATPPNLSATTGIGTASSSGLTTSSAAGVSASQTGGSAASYNSSGWDVGDYFQFQLSTIGYYDIAVWWNQTGSNTGPKNFKIAYSTNGTNFTDVAGGSYSVLFNGAPNSSWSAVNTTSDYSAYQISFDLSSIATIENTASVYFRLIDISTTSINNGTVASGGTNRIDNFTVTGAVPEPHEVAIGVAGLLGLLIVSRRRKMLSKY